MRSEIEMKKIETIIALFPIPKGEGALRPEGGAGGVRQPRRPDAGADRRGTRLLLGRRRLRKARSRRQRGLRSPAERVSIKNMVLSFDSSPRITIFFSQHQGEAQRGRHRADRVRRAVLARALQERPRVDVGQGGLLPLRTRS